MRGFATIDSQPNCGTIAVWITSQVAPLRAGHSNAVSIDRLSDPDAAQKVRSLTRCRVVVLTDGSVADALPTLGQALSLSDINDLIVETLAFQERITGAVETYARRTRNRTLTPPNFTAPPRAEDFIIGFTPPQTAPAYGPRNADVNRAFQTANFVARAWTYWLLTDEERRRRTIRPRTNETPWMMPDEMNDPVLDSLPAAFAKRAVAEPLV